MYTLIAFRVGVHGEEGSSLIILALVFLYTIFLDVILIVVVVVTILTWSKIHDSIHVRGELILQGVILFLTNVTQTGFWFWDQTDGGTEEFDEVIYFGYFATVSICSFIAIIIGTQYVRFRVGRRQETLRKLRKRSLRRIASRAGKSKRNGLGGEEPSVHHTDIDVQMMIAMENGYGLQAFMKYLAKGAELNYLVVK